MKAIKYNVRLLEPLLVRVEGPDPNTLSCAGFIPGTAIRGALIAQYLKLLKNGLKSDEETARRLFFSNQTCFLNAYPCATDGRRALPVPLSFKTLKHGNESTIYDESAIDEEINEQLKSPSRDFCIIDADNATVRGLGISRTLSVHIDRGSTGSPDSNDGTVFNVEAMQEGQILSGILICANDKDLEILKQVLKEIRSLGGSKGGGNGRVSIEAITSLDGKDENLEAESQSPDNSNIVITLSSHSIWRNFEGLLVNSATSAAGFLSELLGEQIKIKSSYAQIEQVGGFNRKWRLPLPEEYALSPGTVFVIENPGESCRERLLEFCKTGMGERINEGFGRICLDMHGTLEKYDMPSSVKHPVARNVKVAADSPAQAQVQLMVDRMARKMLERKLRHYVAGLVLNSGQTSSSQLNKLRNATESLLSQQETGAQAGRHLQEYLDSINQKQHSRDQFEKVKINNERFREWFSKHINLLKQGNGNELCQSLNLSVAELPQIGGVQASLNPELVTEARLRLIQEVLVRLAR
ncbi:MAG: hypothetical protein K2X27_00460 [Candidatus Obscuribacterales bacterium]|nr:hypothetical protein [Candidatus Obscuribacterales bacterium]